VPGWVFDPRQKILTVVLGFVVSGIATFVTTTSNSILMAQRAVFDALRSAGTAVDSSFAAVGDSILSVERSVFGVFVGVGANAGVAAPIAQAIATVIASILVAATILLGYLFLKTVLGLVIPP
jgi:hypothetical protein